MRQVWSRSMLLTVLLVVGTAVNSRSADPEPKPKPEAYPATIAVKADKPDAEGRQRIAVTLTIAKGYHVYANPVGHEDLVEVQTKLTVTGKSKPEVLKITYPKGELIEDKIVGDYRIYTGTVTMEVVVNRPMGDTEPLTVTVRVRPYDDKGCRWGTRSLTEMVP